MPKESMHWLMKASKSVLPVCWGIAITLLVEVIAGDLIWYRQTGAPLGWFGMWILITPLAVAFGFGSMFLSSWRKTPAYQYRKIGLGYISIGLLNSISLALHVSTIRAVPDRIWWGVLGYAIVAFGIWVYFQNKESSPEEIFP